MACPVLITSVDVLDNPSAFSNPLQFEIQYECVSSLEKDLEWRLTYIGNAESEEYDQVLDSVLVGPVFPGQYRFVFQANPPDPARLPPDEILGITAILLTCSYNDKEFVRVGYYVNNEYPEEEPALREDPPKIPVLEKVLRNILADKPRVTKFPIEFDAPAAADELPVAGDMSGAVGGFGDQQAADQQQQAAPGMPSATPFGAGAGFGGQQQQQQQHQQQHQQQPSPGSAAFSGMQLGGQFDAVAQESDDAMQEDDIQNVDPAVGQVEMMA